MNKTITYIVKCLVWFQMEPNSKLILMTEILALQIFFFGLALYYQSYPRKSVLIMLYVNDIQVLASLTSESTWPVPQNIKRSQCKDGKVILKLTKLTLTYSLHIPDWPDSWCSCPCLFNADSVSSHCGFPSAISFNGSNLSSNYNH